MKNDKRIHKSIKKINDITRIFLKDPNQYALKERMVEDIIEQSKVLENLYFNNTKEEWKEIIKKEHKVQQKKIKTNRDYIIAALQGEFDDGGATEEAVIYYNIDCPYMEGDQRGECEKLGKDIGWETCTECKTKWLDSEPDE